jgi:hypothetical protein
VFVGVKKQSKVFAVETSFSNHLFQRILPRHIFQQSEGGNSRSFGWAIFINDAVSATMITKLMESKRIDS